VEEKELKDEEEDCAIRCFFSSCITNHGEWLSDGLIESSREGRKSKKGRTVQGIVMKEEEDFKFEEKS